MRVIKRVKESNNNPISELLDKSSLKTLREEVKEKIKNLKIEIKDEERINEFSRKVDRLYDQLEGNELLLEAVEDTIANISPHLDDKEWKELISDFKEAIDFAERNHASWTTKEILDRVMNSDIKRENRILGDADDHIADNIDLVIRNDYRLYTRMKAVVDSLVKKASKGIELDKSKLAKSSVVDQLVRDTIRYLQKEDHDGDNEGIFDSISTATRNLAKEYVANTILDEVEDAIRFAEK